MKKEILKFNNINYVIYTPENTELSCLPLLIYLHGAGERGTVVEHLDRHAIPKLISQGREYNAIILCPQCPAQFVWDNIVADVKEIIDDTVKKYNVKPDRISITGSSMGGFGTWSMGLTYRNFFSAIGPIAGGGMSWRCANLIKTPIWAFHGKLDTAVPLEYSQRMVDSVLSHGGEAKLTVLEDMGHNDAINHVYEEGSIVDWLLSMRRTDFSYVPESLEDMF